MRLTLSVSYAVGILLQVTRGRKGESMTAARIARGCKFPPRFLYRILRRLVDAGLLIGTSGPGGGYALAKPTLRISVLDIIEAVESPTEPSRLEPVRPKYRRAVNAVNRVSDEYSRRAAQAMKRLTLAKLMRL